MELNSVIDYRKQHQDKELLDRASGLFGVFNKINTLSKSSLQKITTIRELCRQTTKKLLHPFEKSLNLHDRDVKKEINGLETREKPKEIISKMKKFKKIYEKNTCKVSKEDFKKNSIGWFNKWFGFGVYFGKGKGSDIVYRGLREVSLEDIQNILQNGLKPKRDTDNIESKNEKQKAIKGFLNATGGKIGDGCMSTTLSKNVAIAWSKETPFKDDKFTNSKFVQLLYAMKLPKMYYEIFKSKVKSTVGKESVNFENVDIKEIVSFCKKNGIELKDVRFNIVTTINAPRNQRFGYRAPGWISPSNQEVAYMGTLNSIVGMDITGYGYVDKEGKYNHCKTM